MNKKGHILRGLAFILLFLSVTVWAVDRCDSYVKDVRKAHFRVFGLNYPYWYGVAQLKKESGCRDIISRDGVGSQGLAQITFRWWKPFLSKRGIYDIDSITNQALAQAYIMKDAQDKAIIKKLWVSYQIYNGGRLVNKEILRARESLKINNVTHSIARQFCSRKNIAFNNGQVINACDINYNYSTKIYNYGQKWKIGNDKVGFW